MTRKLPGRRGRCKRVAFSEIAISHPIVRYRSSRVRFKAGSASAILASWGPDGPPPDTEIESFWAHLDSLFAPEESNFQRDNRFKAFKLGDFSSVSLFLERYHDEMAKCTTPPSDKYRLGVLATAVQEISIRLHFRWRSGKAHNNQVANSKTNSCPTCGPKSFAIVKR